MNVIHRSTSEELADPGSVSRDEALARLRDWRDRVHELYDEIEREIQDTSFRCDRSGKHISEEEFPRRVGVRDSEQPSIDTLRIVRPDDTAAAVFLPRGLWVIGANGRIDLRITPAFGGSQYYVMLDQSTPFARPAQWILMPGSSPFDRQPFDPHWLLAKLR